MRCRFLFTGKKGYTLGWSGKYRVTNLSFRKGDILLQDEKWGNIYTVVNASKRRKNTWTTDITGAIQDDMAFPLNIKAFWLVIYVKLGQPHYRWYARYFKNVRGY